MSANTSRCSFPLAISPFGIVYEEFVLLSVISHPVTLTLGLCVTAQSSVVSPLSCPALSLITLGVAVKSISIAAIFIEALAGETPYSTI